jgi:hypothetical protein
MLDCIRILLKLTGVDLPSWIIVILTAVIALATIVYAGITMMLWIETKRSADAATTAAKAAKQSADALALIERPWVLVSSAGLTNGWSSTANKSIFFGYLKFKNYGKSPAWVIEQGGSFDIHSNTDDLPPTPIYRDKEDFQDQGVILVPLSTAEDWQSLKLSQPEDQELPLPIGQNPDYVLCFYGYIKYKDIFGQIHETRFCYKVRDPIRATPLDAGPNYTLQT